MRGLHDVTWRPAAWLLGVALLLGLGAVSLTAQPRASLVPSQLITLQASQTSAITNTTTTRTTTTGLDPYTSVDLLINITAAGTATGTLQLFIEDSADGGTTWDDLASSNTFAFGASLVTQRFILAGSNVATGITQGTAAAVETLSAGTVRTGAFGNMIRIREKVSSVGGSPVGPTYSVTGVFKR